MSFRVGQPTIIKKELLLLLEGSVSVNVIAVAIPVAVAVAVVVAVAIVVVIADGCCYWLLMISFVIIRSTVNRFAGLRQC